MSNPSTNHDVRLDIDRRFSVGFTHRLRFASDVLTQDSRVFAEVFEPTSQGRSHVLAFIDDGVAANWPRLQADIKAYFAQAGNFDLLGPIQVVPGGERIKNDQRELESLLKSIHEGGLCRHSYVLVIGGGAVLDAVGFAAAIAHRGIRLVRMPTTTVSQGDSGVGVKNGVNLFGKKNYAGVFAPPWAVVNDFAFLRTLSERDWRSGFSEAVKVALVKDRGLFEQIEQSTDPIRRRSIDASAPIIMRSAELHLLHITEGGDPFEAERARPLDFGHWSAHRLEQLTGHRLRHGEAVAIGLAIDVLYSQLIGMLDRRPAMRILDSLRCLGFALSDESLADPAPILAGLDEFREHLGGDLTITLLREIGEGEDVHEVDVAKMEQAIRMLYETEEFRSAVA